MTALFSSMVARALSAGVLAATPLLAQDATPAAPFGDWLAPVAEQPAVAGEGFHATTGTVAPDPFAVLTSGALWEQAYGEFYTRDLGDTFSLSTESGSVVLDEDGQEISRSGKVGVSFAPAPEFTLSGNFHDLVSEAMIPDDTTTTSGAALAVEGRLPTSSIVSVGLNFDRTVADAPGAIAAQTRAYDAEIQQPLGKLPLSAVFKGEFSGTSVGGAPGSSMPSLEQSLVWKPLANTTVQMGLRQQQYQEFPGVDHELNEALFADLSQQVLDNVTWHSYAEVLNSKSLLDQAPAAPIAGGANGTPQATNPALNTSLGSSLPLSLEDQTVTFSTGPSVQLEKGISARVEYSNRWDKNPAPGSTGQEQRVSVSVKGTF